MIPNKVFQYIMSGSPFITRDSPAMRELVHDAPSDGIWLIPPGDPVALASAVREAVFQFKKPDGLHDELKKRITAQALGLHLLDIINHKQDIQKGAHAT